MLGLLPPEERSAPISVGELLEWEASGQSIGARVDRAWWTRTPKQHTVLEVLACKADAATVKLLQRRPPQPARRECT